MAGLGGFEVVTEEKRIEGAGAARDLYGTRSVLSGETSLGGVSNLQSMRCPAVKYYQTRSLRTCLKALCY